MQIYEGEREDLIFAFHEVDKKDDEDKSVWGETRGGCVTLVWCGEGCEDDAHACVPASLRPCVPASLRCCVPALLRPCVPAS